MGRRTWRLTQVAHLTVNRRKRIHDQPGYWFATRLGPWTGYYLREEAGAVYMPGVLPLLSYDPPRTLELPARHAYVARTYDATGAVTASLTFAPDTPARATVDQRAIVNGIEKVRVASGPLQGHWLRLGPAVLR